MNISKSMDPGSSSHNLPLISSLFLMLIHVYFSTLLSSKHGKTSIPSYIILMVTPLFTPFLISSL
jgi:hypothetical protein